MRCHLGLPAVQAISLKMATQLLESKDASSIKTNTVNALLAALKHVQDLPGVQAAQRNLKQFQQEKIDMIAGNDLLEMLKSTFADNLDINKVKFCVSHCQTWPKEAQVLLPNLVRALITLVMAEASVCINSMWVLWVLSISVWLLLFHIAI